MAGVAVVRLSFQILEAEVSLGKADKEVLLGEAEGDLIEAVQVQRGEAEGEPVAAVEVPLGEASDEVPVSEEILVVDNIVSRIAVTKNGLSFVLVGKDQETIT